MKFLRGKQNPQLKSIFFRTFTALEKCVKGTRPNEIKINFLFHLNGEKHAIVCGVVVVRLKGRLLSLDFFLFACTLITQVFG